MDWVLFGESTLITIVAGFAFGGFLVLLDRHTDRALDKQLDRARAEEHQAWIEKVRAVHIADEAAADAARRKRERS